MLNPRYDQRIKRGFHSIRRFYAGLPFIVYTREPTAAPGAMPVVATSIDIPALGVMTITDPQVVQLLLACSQVSPVIAPVPMQAPPGQTFLKCGRCQATVWLNTMTPDGSLTQAICARCQNTISFLLFRIAGSA